jgi:uncharacterized membrane protein
LELRFRIFLFLLITIWLLGVFIEFFIPFQNNLIYLFPFLENIYSTVCHQQPVKLLDITGGHTLVCARCSGIYIGGFISAFILLFVSKVNFKDGKLMIVASIPMAIDVLLYSSGVYNYSKTIALITGLLLGSIGIAYIYNGLQKLVEKNEKS